MLKGYVIRERFGTPALDHRFLNICRHSPFGICQWYLHLS